MKPIVAPIKLKEQSANVANLQEALSALGFPIPDAEKIKQVAGDGTLKAVRTLQAKMQVTPIEDVLVDAVTASVINRLLKEKNLLDSELFTVSGKVVTDTSAPVAGVGVLAYDERIAGKVLLNQASTDDEGKYNITYASTQLQEKAKPDILIVVVEGRNFKNEVGRSTVKYNATSRETINVVIHADKAPRSPEYDRLLAELQPYLEGKNLRDLLEDDKNGQITHLANKTGWDARIVAMAVQANKMSAASGINPAHYYALFRTGIAGNQEMISKLPAKSVEAMIGHAAESKIISPDSDIENTLNIHRDQSVDFLLRNENGTGVSNLNNFLSLRLNEEEKRSFIEAYQEFAGDNDNLWASLPARGFQEATIKQLQLDGRLGYLTMQNAPLVTRLYETLQIQDPADLVRHGLYKASEWKKVIANDVPKDINPDDYASSMANFINLSYPTEVVAEMIRNQEIKSETVQVDEAYDFLNKSGRQYMLGTAPLKKWDGFDALKPGTKATLKKAERLYQLSPSNESMIALSNTGIDSAYQIMKYTRSEFLQKYSESFPTPQEAALTYNKAQQIHSTAINLAATYLTYRSAPNVYGITGTLEKKQNGTTAYPALEELFGTLDYCACDHCKSVLSPASYMVDLLQFIDLSDIPHELNNPVDVLLNKRPDIQHLQLSCENTNTVLPYIDLVNEILEYYTVNGNVTSFKGHDIEEGTTTEDLLADQEWINENAYVKTKAEVYPFNLPFDQPLAALRLFFNAWDASLEDALRIFNTPLSARKERLGLNKEEYTILTDLSFHTLPEYFGLAPATTIAALNTAIANGKTFCRQVDITYDELVRILKTGFINPGVYLVRKLERLQVGLDTIQALYDATLPDTDFNDLLPAGLELADYNGSVPQWLRDNEQVISRMILLTDINPGGSSGCNFADVQLRYALPVDITQNSLDEIAYHKLHRFTRFWKKSNWKIETIDQLFTTFSPISPADITLLNIDEVFTTLVARIANFSAFAKTMSVAENKLSGQLLIWDTSRDATIRMEQCAKLFKMRLDDLNSLSKITGIDPLAADLETDEPSIARFQKIIAGLKSASIKVADLAYLLQHQDDTGKLIPADEFLLKNIKTLRDGLTAVERENGIAPDNADFNFAKNKMSLVYDGSVADAFFGLLSNGRTYTASFSMMEEILPSKLTSIDAALGYDPFKKLLSYTGMLPDVSQNLLNTAADDLVLADVTEITLQPDLDALKTDFKNALQVTRDAMNTELNDLASRYPELKIIYDLVKAEPDPARQTTVLLDNILPQLKERSKRNALQLLLAGLLKTDAGTIAAITSNAAVLHAASDDTKSILDDFLNLEENLVFSANQVYNGYLDAPATDDYILYVKAPQNTTITLSINGRKIIDAAVTGVSNEIQNAVPLSMEAGSLNALKLEIAGLPGGQNAELLWRTKGMARAPVGRSALYVQQRVDDSKTSLLRLQKAAQLQQVLKLTARELTYFAAENDETKGFLNDLDTTGTISDGDLRSLWIKISGLVYFTVLKKENEPEENTWVRVLEDPGTEIPAGNNLLCGINEWKKTDLDAVLVKMAIPIADVSRLRVLQKVKEAMQLISTIDFPAAAVIAWTTDSPVSATITAIKSVIRDKTDDAAWLDTMESVSDALRNQQRDALVNYILFHLRPLPGIDTADKLYEHFLIDVNMDACMKTSRIVHALSTIQLFIYRCLMNLEKEVAPSSIRAQQWQWMSRYRVWEANRKIFLYPENWLEPELRDNKSSFYKELEGELLQSDINNELAETAFLNYLKKLDDVAKLEIVGMYLQENEKGNQNDDILHVVGRTNGSTRQYYYRRYEYGYWIPWEKIALNIEGDHIFPVIWKSRLFLFWLNVIEKATEGDRSDSPQGMSTASWGANARKNIEINMCWGEYYKGKWTSPKSSDLSKPIILKNVETFNAKEILLYARKEKPDPKISERLIFFLWCPGLEAVVTYTSRNSPPDIVLQQADNSLKTKVAQFNYEVYRKAYEGPAPSQLNGTTIDIPSGKFKVDIDQPSLANQAIVTENVLSKTNWLPQKFSLLTLRHPVENQWEAPFFYTDEQSIFFAQPDESHTLYIWEYNGFYDVGSHFYLKDHIKLPPLVEKPVVVQLPEEIFHRLGQPVIDPSPWFQVLTKANQNYKQVLPSGIGFGFNGTNFGAGGKIPVDGGITHG